MTEYKNRSLTRALGILDVLLNASRGLLLTEIANAATLDRATAYRLLHILVARGYVHRDMATKRYSMKLSFYFRSNGDLPSTAARIARPALRQLFSQTEAAVSVASFQGAEIRYHQELLGRDQQGEELFRGKRLPSHATACGKIMLAFRPQDEIRKIYEFMPLSVYTPQTIHDIAVLERHLGGVRERGFAVNDREFVKNRVCIALPIRTPKKLGALALSISLPSAQVDARNIGRLVDTVRQAGERVGKLLEGQSRTALDDLGETLWEDAAAAN